MAKEFTFADLLNQEQEEKEKRIPVRTSLKQQILFNQKGKCSHCSLNFLEFGIYPDFHHKDGNPTKNSDDNIEAICPNCHRRETHQQHLDRAKEKDKQKEKKKKQNSSLNIPKFESPKFKPIKFDNYKF